MGVKTAGGIKLQSLYMQLVEEFVSSLSHKSGEKKKGGG